MATVHVVRTGETLLSIADLYGFRAWQTIAEAPENAELFQRRGSPHSIRQGDEIHIPEGQIGEVIVPVSTVEAVSSSPGNEGAEPHHKVVVRTHEPLLEIRVYTEFRFEPSAEARGSKKGSDRRWKRGGSVPPLGVQDAAIVITPGPHRVALTNRSGTARVAALTDGTSTLKLIPDADQLSPGPALADDERDHGLDYGKGNVTRSRARDKKAFFEIEYRPLELEIEVVDGKIEDVSITSKKRDDRPHHAVCFWRDVPAGIDGVNQVLEIDLKPDFLRRVDAGGTGVHPPISKRPKTPGIRLFQVHHTTGNEIGSAINKFINQNSGIHFLNDRDGHVVRMVDDRYQTTHGGGKNGAVQNAWADMPDINGQAIGVENVQGKDFEYTDAQVSSLIGLIHAARARYPQILINHVVGHCDVYSGKLDCPGAKFPWIKLESAAASLRPQTIDDVETEWGGLFAGVKGKARKLREGDRDREEADGTFSVTRGKQVVASGLSLGPIALLNECLHEIGYTPNRNGKKVADFETWKTKHIGTFGASTRVAIKFFKAHYCAEERPSPSKKSPFLDEHLAKLILGCYRTLTG